MYGPNTLPNAQLIAKTIREYHLNDNLCSSLVCNDVFFKEVMEDSRNKEFCLIADLCTYTYRYVKNDTYKIIGAEKYAMIMIPSGSFVHKRAYVGFYNGLQYIVTTDSVQFCPDCTCSLNGGPSTNSIGSNERPVVLNSWKSYKMLSKAPPLKNCDFHKMYVSASPEEREDMVSFFRTNGVDFEYTGHKIPVHLIRPKVFSRVASVKFDDVEIPAGEEISA